MRPASDLNGGTQRLQRLSVVLRAYAADEDAAWMADCIDRFIAEGTSLDLALGLRRTGGQHSWETIARLRRRDELIREGQRIILQRDLPDTLQQRELRSAGTKLSADASLPRIEAMPWAPPPR